MILIRKNSFPIYRYLLKNDYIDDNEHITEQYHADLENNALAPLAEELKPMTEGIHKLIQSIFNDKILEDMGYRVSLEEKLLDHHYTHLVIFPAQSQNDKKIAIELGDMKTHPKYMKQINGEYLARGIPVNWLLVDDKQRNARIEYKKYLEWYLNSGACNKHLVVLSHDMTEVAEYKNICAPNEYPQTIGSIDDLAVIDDEILLRKC